MLCQPMTFMCSSVNRNPTCNCNLLRIESGCKGLKLTSFAFFQL